LSDRISLGVIAGLVIGKQLGVSLAAWLAVRLGLADLPEGVSWREIIGAGWLAGIGFTMSLFIAALAFGDTPEQEAAKVGILAVSLIAGLVGYFLLRRSVSADPISKG
jgi:NhaA family Na+:H+ antiporter